MSRSDRGDRGRWLAEGQTDEGTMIARFRLSEGVSPPRRRVSFWGPRKKPKRHQGVSAIGGRVRTPAPTEYPETRLSLRRDRSQTGPGVPVGGHMGPPLRFERTALIIGPFPSSASLCSAPSPRGRLAGAHCAPLRRKTGWERWFGSGRRRNKTAPVPIFFPLRPPVGPDGMAPKHSWYCAPEGPHNVQGVTPVMGSGGKANMSAPRSS